MPPVVHCGLTLASNLCMIQGTENEVPILAHGDSRVPFPYRLYDGSGEEQRGKPHGEAVKEARDRRRALNP